MPHNAVFTVFCAVIRLMGCVSNPVAFISDVNFLFREKERDSKTQRTRMMAYNTVAVHFP